MSGCGRLDGCGSAAEPRPGVRTVPSTVDTAAACGCPLLGRVWPDGHPSSQISSEAITTMAR